MNTIPIKKNQLLELEIDALTGEGAGVGRLDGYVLLVSVTRWNVVSNESTTLIIPAAVRAGIIGVIHPVIESIIFDTTLLEL